MHRSLYIILKPFPLPYEARLSRLLSRFETRARAERLYCLFSLRLSLSNGAQMRPSISRSQLVPRLFSPSRPLTLLPALQNTFPSRGNGKNRIASFVAAESGELSSEVSKHWENKGTGRKCKIGMFVPLIHVGLIVTASAAISFSRLVGYYCDEYIGEVRGARNNGKVADVNL